MSSKITYEQLADHESIRVLLENKLVGNIVKHLQGIGYQYAPLGVGRAAWGCIYSTVAGVKRSLESEE